MKALEFIYQETQIHFLLQNEGQVMVNATEMAKAFGKRIDVFLKTEPTKAFISVLQFTPTGGNSEPITLEKIVQAKGHMGTYFHRILALKFAAWLDPQFELWVYSHIEEVLFGNYKKHWDAHQVQEKAKDKMTSIKKQLFTLPTIELVTNYFEAESEYNSAGNIKRKALRDQMKFDFPE